MAFVCVCLIGGVVWCAPVLYGYVFRYACTHTIKYSYNCDINKSISINPAINSSSPVTAWLDIYLLCCSILWWWWKMNDSSLCVLFIFFSFTLSLSLFLLLFYCGNFSISRGISRVRFHYFRFHPIDWLESVEWSLNESNTSLLLAKH